jgi:hypothetical protein
MPASQATEFRWLDVIGARLFLLAGLSLACYFILVVVLAALWFSPTGKEGQYAVLVPPWIDFKEAVDLATRVDGLVIDMNRNTGIALMYVSRPDAVDSLYQSGALMVLDPGKLGDSGLGGLCVSTPSM